MLSGGDGDKQTRAIADEPVWPIAEIPKAVTRKVAANELVLRRWTGPSPAERMHEWVNVRVCVVESGQ